MHQGNIRWQFHIPAGQCTCAQGAWHNRTWVFESVLNWMWPCCISTHLTFQVSQGSAATDLRWGENFNTFLFRNSLLYIAVKKLRKSDRSIFVWVIENIKVSRFYGPQCTIARSLGQSSPAATVHQCQLGVPSLGGQLMSSESWGVNGHTTH